MSFSILQHTIGHEAPCYVIAEAGVNHNGSLDTAIKLVDVAADCGAHAVKFQTFRADRLVNKSAPTADYQRANTGLTESQFEMLSRLELSREHHLHLIQHCKQRGITFLSTPFDEISADFLEDLNVPAIKVSSGDLTNIPFLCHLARKNKPLIISTGMSFLGEVEMAVQAIRANGNPPFVLLQCVSNYPSQPEDSNLLAMNTLAAAFQCPVGYSDHTLGCQVPLAAVALGACVVEKHFTLDRSLPGPDHAASAEPAELKALVDGIQIVKSSLGHGRKEPSKGELNTSKNARKSIAAARTLAPGTKISRDMLQMLRPGTGLPPAMIELVIGRTVRALIEAGQLISLDLIS